jgi:hypothetical protein
MFKRADAAGFDFGLPDLMGAGAGEKSAPDVSQVPLSITDTVTKDSRTFPTSKRTKLEMSCHGQVPQTGVFVLEYQYRIWLKGSLSNL